MPAAARSACACLAVSSLLVLAACRDRFFDNPLDPSAGEVAFEVVATITTPAAAPRGLTWDGTALWNVDGSNGTLIALNAASGAVLRTLPAPVAQASDAAYDGADLWICSEGSPDVFRINLLNGDVQKRLSLQRGAFSACEFALGSLWLADIPTNRIQRVDPETGQILSSFSDPGTRAQGLAFDGQRFWISDPRTLTIYALDTAGGVLAKYLAPGPSPQGLAFDGRFLWNADANGKLYQLRFRS